MLPVPPSFFYHWLAFFKLFFVSTLLLGFQLNYPFPYISIIYILP